MRLIQLVRNLDLGGLERLAVDLAVRQKQEGHQSAIFCLFDSGVLAPQAEAAGIPVVAFGKKQAGAARVLARLANHMRRFNADVIHTHNPGIHHYGVAAARLAGIPVVVNTLHGGSDSAFPTGRRAWVFRAALRWTDALVVVSQKTLDAYVQRVGIRRDRARVILNGIPVERFEKRQARPGSARPKIRFGTAGRLAGQKDHLTLLRAFARVVQQVPGAELHIAGDGPLRPQIEQEIGRLCLLDRVVLHGVVHDMASFLAGLDVFVLSSISEGLPLAVLEAMAAGLPIVSTRVDGVSEIFPEDQAARLCPPQRPDLLAEAMCQAAADEQLAAKGANAARLACSRWSTARMWHEYEALFHELLRRRGRPFASPATAAEPD